MAVTDTTTLSAGTAVQYSRDTSVDVLRGFAIFTMVAANMAPYHLRAPHPFFFRVYASVAAPIFVFLCGMMVSLTAARRTHNLRYYALRGASTLVIAALIDWACWKVTPFTTFDVLYIIALSMPLSRLLISLKLWKQLAVVAAILASTPWLQRTLGYGAELLEMMADEPGIHQVPALHSFLISGWFPVFPWLGVALLGAAAGSLKLQQGGPRSSRLFLRAGIPSMAVGVVAWLLHRPVLNVRGGYSELFYPPTLPYLLTSLGIVLILLSVLPKIKTYAVLGFFESLGKVSLFIYVLHIVIIAFILRSHLGQYPIHTFALLYLLHMFVIWLLSRQLQRFNRRSWPFFLRFLLGS